MDDIKLTGLYDVQNPWGEQDPVSLRGLNARIDAIAGKTIGLFATRSKLAAVPIMEAVERQLQAREPSLKFAWFLFDHNAHIAETDDKERFAEWAQGIDAAVAAVGD